MTPILNFISHYHQALLLLLYSVLSFVFITISDKAIVEGIRSTSLVIYGSIEEKLNTAGSYFDLNQTNQILRKENTRLAYENEHLKDALLENIRLRKLLQFKYEVEYNLIPAKVIGFAPQNLITGLLLSNEEIVNIKNNSSVMTSEGLVGKIVKIASDYAICQILLDPNSRVSAKVQRTRELGIIKWDGANGFLLDNIPNTTNILVGDVIFTSGLSQIFPSNIKIGVVTSVVNNAQELFKTIHVLPSVNFNRLEEVFIYNPKNTDESGS